MHFTILRNGNLTKANLEDVHEKCTVNIQIFFSFKYFTEGAHELNLINGLSSEIKVL